MDKCSQCVRDARFQDIETGVARCTFHYNRWMKEQRIARKLAKSMAQRAKKGDE